MGPFLRWEPNGAFFRTSWGLQDVHVGLVSTEVVLKHETFVSFFVCSIRKLVVSNKLRHLFSLHA